MAKKATKKRTVKTDEVPFGENKSDKIRAVLDSGIVKPAAVIAELKGKGVEVTSGLVAAVKQKHLGGKKKKRGRRKGGVHVGNGRVTNGLAIHQTLKSGVEFIKSCGGVKEAHAFLDLIEDIRGNG